MHNHNVIIIGAGPAGISCAIQLKRSGIDVKVIDKNKPANMLRNARLIENYPGFPRGIKGNDFADILCSQFRSFKIPFLQKEINDVSHNHSGFVLNITGKIGKCKYLVAATGSRPVKLNFFSNNIYYEIHELRNIRNKDIAIVGSGDIAFDYALSMSVRNNVTLFNRRGIIKAIECLKREFIKKRIKYFDNMELTDVKERGKEKDLMFLNTKTKDTISYKFDYLVAATGRLSETSLIENIKSDNLYIAGDAENALYRQSSIAAGSGMRAAINIINNIKNSL